jgi:hypothetical protein
MLGAGQRELGQPKIQKSFSRPISESLPCTVQSKGSISFTVIKNDSERQRIPRMGDTAKLDIHFYRYDINSPSSVRDPERVDRSGRCS